MEVHWFKKDLPAAERLRSQEAFIARSRLSHLFGRKLFLLDDGLACERTLSGLLDATDALIDRFDSDRAVECARYVSTLESLVSSTGVLAESADKSAAVRILQSIRRLFQLLADGRGDALVEFCNRDEAFIGAWGMPSHFAVFRFEPEANA
jgi:hypothetical protein